MTTRFLVSLKVTDGYTYVVISDSTGLMIGDFDEVYSVKLDDVLKVPNAIYDIVALAQADNEDGLDNLFKEIQRRTMTEGSRPL